MWKHWQSKPRGVCEPIYPLKESTVVAVAAALKAANVRSAPSYLSELKLGHIEARHEVPDWLNRTLSLCCRAATRGLGPPSRAPELRIEHIRDAAEALVGRGAGDVLHPWRSYIVAHFWMLREIELAGLTCSQVSVSEGDRSATIVLLVSKDDQAGKGVSRTLFCGCRSLSAPVVCPVHAVLDQLLAVRDLAEVLAIDPDHAPLFPTPSGGVPAKNAVCEAWSRLSTCGPLTGHSARRSGAKYYARTGWTLPAIQRLGRWASKQVMKYVEEALSETTVRPTLPAAALQSRPLALEGSRTASLELRISTLEGRDTPYVLGTCKVHVRLPVPLTTSSVAWQASCGWRFSAGTFALLTESQLASCAATRCARCFDPRRGAAKPVRAEGTS